MIVSASLVLMWVQACGKQRQLSIADLWALLQKHTPTLRGYKERIFDSWLRLSINDLRIFST